VRPYFVVVLNPSRDRNLCFFVRLESEAFEAPFDKLRVTRCSENGESEAFDAPFDKLRVTRCETFDAPFDKLRVTKGC